MTMTLELTPELKGRLERAAEQEGLEPEGYVVRLLEERLPGEVNRRALEVLQSFMESAEADAQDQRETGEFLVQALDEDRPSYRQLFPCRR